MTKKSNSAPLVVIGAGQAAAQFVQAARKQGLETPIRIFGDEAFAPYQRPPLSKAYLKGEFAEERLYFKPAAYYAENNAELNLGAKVVRIKPEQHEIELQSGEKVAYSKLLIATGSRPRPMPGLDANLRNVHVLRTIEHSQDLGELCKSAKHITIVGGGYIGLEVAAVARGLGLDVTLLEREDRLLARVTSPTVSAYYAQLHRENGVDLRLSANIDEIQTEGETVSGIKIADGEVIKTDALLVGIGGLPNQELAESAGLPCENGIIVDEDAKTADPDIYAAGDCSRRPLEGQDSLVRVESVHNALDQADLAAAHIAGAARPNSDTPWFWSDQYHVKLQTVGLFGGYTEAAVRGSADDVPFTVFYYKGDDLIAADCLNDPAAFLVTKQLLKMGISVDKSELLDPEVPLKEVLQKAKAAAAG